MSDTTQNDWEKRFDEMFPCRHHAAQCGGDCNDKIKNFLRRELEDARREVIEKIQMHLDFAKQDTEMADDPEDPKVRIKYLEHVLATLKEETT